MATKKNTKKSSSKKTNKKSSKEKAKQLEKALAESDETGAVKAMLDKGKLIIDFC